MVLRAAQRIDSRVRRVDEALDGPPEKPKRMHWARYEQLSAQYAEACEARRLCVSPLHAARPVACDGGCRMS